MKADLHIHSHFSDSNYSLEELAREAVLRGVPVLGIADHDTLHSVEEINRMDSLEGVELVPGIELSCADPGTGRKVHLLGFYPDPAHAGLISLCSPILARREENARHLVEYLREKGYSISWEEVTQRAKASRSVYRQHVLLTLYEKGYQKTLFGEVFQTAVKNFKPLHNDYVNVFEGLETLKNAGALVSLAHPVLYDSYELIPRLKEKGLDALEIYHPTASKDHEAKGLYYTEKYYLQVTGGTDFHGLLDEYPDKNVGDYGCSLTEFDLFKKRR